MLQQRDNIQACMTHKREVLAVICDVYSNWVKAFPLACRQGCSACCTQHVTMTSLEGEIIIDFISRNGPPNWLQTRLGSAGTESGLAGMTMNQFAAACLRQQDIEEDTQEGWDFTPCIFLQEDSCLIYAARPFGCRSFASRVQCSAGQPAEITPLHLTVNTVFTQIIEHLSSDGGSWSTMTAILHDLTAGNTRAVKSDLLPAHPVPGFLLVPYEVPVLQGLLQQVARKLSARGICPDLIDNFMPI